MAPRSSRQTVWLPALLMVLAAPAAFAQAIDLPAGLEPLTNFPSPSPMMVSPREYGAAGALIAAAMLSVLYLYRGRRFIVYWITAWGLIAAALSLMPYIGTAQPGGGAVLGLVLLFIVWSAALMLVAVRAFPAKPLRWEARVRGAIASAAWFLTAPLVVAPFVVIASAVGASFALLAWAAAGYLSIGRRGRYAGAYLIGICLAIVCAVDLGASILVLRALGSPPMLNALAAVNVVTGMFIGLGMHLLVFEDMTDELRRTNRDLEMAHDEVKRLAITDPLTGCHNRRFFDEIERREMQRHRRYGSPLSVVFVDINEFKKLNDTHGHDRGDEFLRLVGAVLRREVRESDYVIRWGGDEFLLVLACGHAEAQSKAAELKEAMDRERIAAMLPHPVGLSVGIAAVSRDAESLRDAIREADRRMYRDKLTERAPL